MSGIWFGQKLPQTRVAKKPSKPRLGKPLPERKNGEEVTVSTQKGAVLKYTIINDDIIK